MDKWPGGQNSANHCHRTEYEIKKKEEEEYSQRDLWDNTKCTSIPIIRVPEEEENKKGTEKVFEEIIIKKFPNMGKEILNQVQEAQSLIQDKPKEKHIKTHTNQANRD